MKAKCLLIFFCTSLFGEAQTFFPIKRIFYTLGDACKNVIEDPYKVIKLFGVTTIFFAGCAAHYAIKCSALKEALRIQEAKSASEKQEDEHWEDVKRGVKKVHKEIKEQDKKVAQTIQAQEAKWKKKFEDEKTQHTEEVLTRARENRKLQEENTRLHSERTSLSQSVHDLQLSIHDLEEHDKTLGKKLAIDTNMLQHAMENYKTECNNWKEAADTAQAEYEHLQKQLQEVQQKHNTEVIDKEKEIGALKRQITDLSLEITTQNDLQEKINKLNQEKKELCEQHTVQLAEITKRLQEKVDALQAWKNENEKPIDALKHDVNETHRLLKQSQKEAEQAQVDKEKIAQALAETEKKLHTQQEEQQRLLSAIDGLNKEKEKLYKQLHATEHKYLTLAGDHLTLVGDVESTHREKDTLIIDLKAKISEIRDNFQAQVDQKDQQIQALQKQMKALDTKKNETEELVKKITAQLQTQETALNRYKKTEAELLAKIVQYEQSLERHVQEKKEFEQKTIEEQSLLSAQLKTVQTDFEKISAENKMLEKVRDLSNTIDLSNLTDEHWRFFIALSQALRPLCENMYKSSLFHRGQKDERPEEIAARSCGYARFGHTLAEQGAILYNEHLSSSNDPDLVPLYKEFRNMLNEDKNASFVSQWTLIGMLFNNAQQKNSEKPMALIPRSSYPPMKEEPSEANTVLEKLNVAVIPLEKLILPLASKTQE